MPFIKGIWVEPTKQEKQKISPSQVNMQFLLARPVGKTYRVVQSLMITNNKIFDPRPLQFRNVNKKSLYDSIISKVAPYDRPYMKLVNFTTTRATFDFDWNKWIRDAVANVKPNNRISKFEQRFKFKKQVPRMISFSNVRLNFGEFIVRKFKEYMSKNRKDRVWFDRFLPREFAGKIRTKLSTMFNYEYDWQQNEVVAKLKDVYIMGILFALGNEIAKDRSKPYVKIDFEKSVKRKARNFDRNKWESFIKKRFI